MSKIKAKTMKNVNFVAKWLTLVGGVNWGLVGIMGFNLVLWLQTLVGVTWLANVVYALVGISALFLIAKEFKVI